MVISVSFAHKSSEGDDNEKGELGGYLLKTCQFHRPISFENISAIEWTTILFIMKRTVQRF